MTSTIVTKRHEDLGVLCIYWANLRGIFQLPWDSASFFGTHIFGGFLYFVGMSCLRTAFKWDATDNKRLELA